MNNIKRYLVLCIAVLSLLCSCIQKETPDKKTTKIKDAYLGWDEVVSSFIKDYANIAFHFNTWLTSPDALKDSIEDQYFKLIKIRQKDAKSWTLEFSSVPIYRIEIVEGADLGTLGSLWKITAYNDQIKQAQQWRDPYDYYSEYKPLLFEEQEIIFYISHQSLNEWYLSLPQSAASNPDMYFLFRNNAATTPTDIFADNVSINGGGHLNFQTVYGLQNQIISLAFLTTTPLQAKEYKNSQYKNLQWLQGEITLEASSSGYSPWSSSISMQSQGEGYYYISIHYKSIEESWNFPETYTHHYWL